MVTNNRAVFVGICAKKTQTANNHLSIRPVPSVPCSKKQAWQLLTDRWRPVVASAQDGSQVISRSENPQARSGYPESRTLPRVPP